MKMMRRWLPCLALSMMLVSAEEPKPEPFASLATVKEELWMLTTVSEEKLQRVVKELRSDQFDDRQKARERLMRAPKSWAPLLKKLSMEHEDPEVRKSLIHVLSEMKSEGRTTAMELAHSVLVHGHRSLGADFISALPTVPDRRSAEKVIEAARLSATDDELGVVTGLLSSNDALVREGAVRVISVLMADPPAPLGKLLDDKNGMVRLTAGETFAIKSDPRCLEPLVVMLGSDDFYLRWKAAGILRLITKDGIGADPLKKTDFTKIDLDQWRKPEALSAWNTDEPLPLIPLFGPNEDLSTWVLARGSLADKPELEPQSGFLRSRGTGLYVWASPLRFQNYRVHLDWRFEWEDRASNGGLSLTKFNGPPPENFNAWSSANSIEIEIREGKTGTLYPHGTEIKVAGKKAPREVKTHHAHNEQSAAWNTLEVEERDGTLRVWVNGLLQNEATGLDDALTTFGLRAERIPVDCRNMKLEPLPGARVASPLTVKKGR